MDAMPTPAAPTADAHVDLWAAIARMRTIDEARHVARNAAELLLAEAETVNDLRDEVATLLQELDDTLAIAKAARDDADAKLHARAQAEADLEQMTGERDAAAAAALAYRDEARALKEQVARLQGDLSAAHAKAREGEQQRLQLAGACMELNAFAESAERMASKLRRHAAGPEAHAA